MKLTNRKLALVVASLGVVAIGFKAQAQFSAPTCVPPNCNPTVIQNIAVNGVTQTASINISGNEKLGSMLITGAAAPVLSLATDNLIYGNVGATSANGSLMLLQFGAADRLRVSLLGQLQLPLGTVAAPSYTFLGDTNNGIYSPAADQIGFTTAGAQKLLLSAAGTTVSAGQLSVPAGTVLLPSITFNGDTNTGIFESAADTLNLVTNGVTRESISSTGFITVPGSIGVTGTFSAAAFAGDGSGLTNLNASNLSNGTVPSGAIGGTYANAVTFNNAANSFTGNGAGLSGISATNITTGTLPDAQLSANIARLNAIQTFTAANTFSSASNNFTGVGTGLTALNGTNVTSGTVADTRLSANIPLKNAANTFSGNNTLSGATTFGGYSRVNAAGQNLLWGQISTTSTGGNFLLFEKGAGVPKFSVDYNGNTVVGGNLTVTGTISGGVAEADTLQSVTTRGNTTTTAMNVGGNLSTAGNFTATGMVTLGEIQTSPWILGRTLGANQNLIYGVADHSSSDPSADLILLQTSDPDGSYDTKFAVTKDGNASVAGSFFAPNGFSGGYSGQFNVNNVGDISGGNIYSFGQPVCVQNGTNCPPSSISGTAGRVTRFATANTLGNSIIQDNGSTIGIGTTPPATALVAFGPTSLAYGISGATSALNGVGIFGASTNAGGGIGVYGQGVGAGTVGVGTGASGVGVQGSGPYAGVTGAGNGGASSVGVQGSGPSGVNGYASNVWGYGVYGNAAPNSYVYGVYGTSSSNQFNSAGVAGNGTNNAMGGYFQANTAGVYALMAYNGAGGSAFQAQGTSNFTGAVTMNSSLAIGGTFRLGNLSSAPAGATGMMYYDTVLGKMRCYEGGWVNCLSSMGGSGTLNYLPKFTPNSTTLANSLIYDNGTNVGIGTNTPVNAFALTVNEAVSGQGGLAIIGDGVGDNRIRLDNNTATDGYIFQQASDANRLVMEGPTLGFNTNGASRRIDVDASGYVTFYQTIGAGGVAPDPNYGIRTQGNYGGIYSSTSSYYGGYFYNSGNSYYGVYGQDAGTAGVGVYGYGSGASSMGVKGDGSQYGVYGSGGSYGLYGFSNSGYGVDGFGAIGGIFAPTGAGATVYNAYYNSYGVYVGSGDTYGIVAYGASTGARFYDSDGTADAFLAGATWGIQINTGGAEKPGGGSWSVTSDVRTKRDVTNFKDGLETIRKLRPVNYTYNGLGGTPDGMKSIGLIAQEVKDIAPYLIMHDSRKLHPDDATNTDLLLVDPSAIPFMNVNAIKELDLRIDGLEAKVDKIDEVDGKVQELEGRVQELEAQVKALQARP